MFAEKSVFNTHWNLNQQDDSVLSPNQCQALVTLVLLFPVLILASIN